MMNYILAGVAALVVAGGAYMFLSGNSGSDAITDGADVAQNIASNATDDNGSDASDDQGSDAPQMVASNDTTDNASSSTQSSNSTPRMHPVKKVCITYVSSGPMMNGTTTSCHRKWALERYEIVFSEIGFGGITQTQNQHTIYIGDQIYAIDLDTDTGIQTTSLVYAGLASAMENSTPEEMSTAFIAGMGYTPTSETKTIADMNCTVYSAAQLGTACLTDSGLMLEQEFMGNKQTAQSVSLNDGGDNANYTLYQTVPISQGPDLSNGIDGLMEQMGGNN